ncbi:syntaxin-binding protein 4 isoform 1-T3 [Discoglossus pictus]
MASPIQTSEYIQVITVTKETTLGLSLVGGISRTEGPLIYIKDIIPGGDCHKDGRLRPGDQLVSINKESLVGVPCEKAKSILNRAKLRKEPSWEVAFFRPGSSPPYPDQTIATKDCAQKPKSEDISRLSSSASAVKPNLSYQSGCIKDQCLIDSSERGTSDVSTLDHIQTHSQENMSINPGVRFKVEQLEMALNYLGVNPTEEQKQSMRQLLQIDANGTASYGEFVKVARNMFKLQLKEADLGQSPTLCGDRKVTNIPNSITNQVQACDHAELNDIERLQRERNEAYAEIKKLKEQLLESEKREHQLSKELKNVKQEAKAAVEETRSLRSRIQIAEVAEKQARGVEMDYEEVIRMLEAEIMGLSAQLADHSGPNKDSVQDFKKRITVLDCQLRKSEIARKTFEVSTERLLRFVEDVHEVLSDNTGSVLSLSERIPAFSSQTLALRIGQNRRGVTAALAAEAKELARSVRSVIQNDCLPYGWEEACTADGIKYFINHVTQTTSWTHPVVSAMGLSCQDEIGEDILYDSPELKSC